MVLLPRRALGGILAGTVLVAALSGCGGASTSDSATGVELVGEFLNTASSTFALVEDTQVQMAFEENRISVSAGCNTMFGQFQLNDSQLQVSPLASTMIGCPQTLADQDLRLAEYLEAGPLVSSSQDGFTLAGASGETLVMVAREVADPDQPLIGTSWRLESITESEAIISAVGFEAVELEFAEGDVQVSSPCATGSATYTELEDGNLTTGPLVLTPAAQPDPQACTAESGILEALAALTQLFDGTVEVQNDGSRVTLTGNGIGVTVRAG